MSADDDDHVTIKAWVCVNAEGEFAIRDTEECETIADFIEAFDYNADASSPKRIAQIEIRIKKPRDPVVEAVVEIPDEQALEPATASAA